MAKHFKEKEPSKRGRYILVSLISVAVIVAACFAVANGQALYAIAGLFSHTAHTSSTVAEAVTTTATTTQPVPEPEPQYAVPEEMKGVWLVAGTDYLVSGKESAAQVKKQIDTAFDSIAEWEFNTLLLPLHRENEALYPSEVMKSLVLNNADGSRFEPLEYIVAKAREKKLYIYGVLDLHVHDGTEEWDPMQEGVTENTVKMATEGASCYALDGLFVTGFAYPVKQISAEEREAACTAVDRLVTQVATALTAGDRDRYVGLISYGVWAHRSVNEQGSNTSAYYEEYTDGCADTLSWLKRGLFHCVMADIGSSTVHATASFQTVLSWWETVATELNLPLYISHAANTGGSYLAGWKSPDQLAQQYLYCKESTAWCGSAYKSLTALRTDKQGMADTLKKAYAGTLNEEYIYQQLTISQPKSTAFTTTESTVTFEGGGDTNFPMTVNGNAVELSEHGFFTQRYSLSIGLNTFVFSHKDKTVTYKITYKQTLLSEVSPSSAMTVDGGSTFIIRATARSGSAVTAKINGATVKLEVTENKEEESGGLPSDFESYMGSYTLPSGTVGQEKKLGAITVTATYNGLTETLTGGSITLEALPMPTTTVTTTTTTTAATTVATTVTETTGTAEITSGGTGSNITTMPTTVATTVNSVATPPADGTQDIVVIKSDYAETFNGGSAVDDSSRPYNSYLPKGTQDKLVSKVYNGKLSYYLLASGKRVYQKDAELVKGALNEASALTNGSASVTSMHTVLTFQAGWNVPVYLAAYPQKYYKDITTGTPNYSLENYGQTAEYVDVTFHYVTGVPAAPNLQGNPLFSSAQWIEKGSNVWVLRLTLKTKGHYYGHQLVWTGDTLKISFLNPVDIAQNPADQKLKGIRILLDPGHGTDDDKPQEAPFNLAYANELKSKLEALGATVTMTRTEHLGNKYLSLPDRVAKAHAGDYHMVISVHMNGFDGTATGATVHYHGEQGYTLASYIYPQMHAVETTYGVGTSTNGRPRSSGTVWGSLYMTRSIFDCPSVLLECAFLDNPKDKEALIDSVYRSKLMQAVTDGVIAYFEAM